MLTTGFYRTYEGLKHNIRVHRMANSEVFIVPMRDWNRSTVQCWLSVICVFIVPMRDWNKIHLLYQPTKQKFLSYLWGIETIACNTILERYTCVFIVPMRDWNSANPSGVRSRSDRFYRTYEGLKPFARVPLAAALRCFYRTYEGLKRGTGEWLGRRDHQRFYRTYEGLKHCLMSLGLFEGS